MSYVFPLVLTFSASDPTGGAGLQADLLTISAMGAHALTVVTGLTAQNTVGVTRFEPCSADWIEAQLSCLLQDEPLLQAAKLGVLGSLGAVERVLAWRATQPDLPLVLDPVMASGRGDALGGKPVFELIKSQLCSQVSLMTPNWPEAKALSGKRSPANAAKFLLDLGCGAVLLKGEHMKSDQVVNRLYLQSGEVLEFPCERLPHQYHGSGCTLASACAAALAQGLPLQDAVALALDFTWGSLKNGFAVGKGQLLPDRQHLMHEAALQMGGVRAAA